MDVLGGASSPWAARELTCENALDKLETEEQETNWLNYKRQSKIIAIDYDRINI